MLSIALHALGYRLLLSAARFCAPFFCCWELFGGFCLRLLGFGGVEATRVLMVSIGNKLKMPPFSLLKGALATWTSHQFPDAQFPYRFLFGCGDVFLCRFSFTMQP